MTHRRIGSRLFTGLIFFFLYAPIFLLIIFSFNASKSRSVWAGFTLDWYVSLFQNSRIISAFITTLSVSALAALIATILGTAAAIGFTAMRKKPRSICMGINNIPMTNADIITGISLMLLFVFSGSLLTAFFNWFNGTALAQMLGISIQFHFRLGFLTLLIAHITFNVPYVILSVMPRLYQLDPNLVEAANDLGATPWQAFWKVLIPELRPGILNGLIIAFTMSIDDFMISYFTSGNVYTLAMEIYSMTRKRISPEINALSTILFVSVLTLLIIVNVREVLQSRRENQNAKELRP